MSTSRDDFGIVIRSALLQRGAKQKFSLFVLILLSPLPQLTTGQPAESAHASHRNLNYIFFKPFLRRLSGIKWLIVDFRILA